VTVDSKVTPAVQTICEGCQNRSYGPGAHPMGRGEAGGLQPPTPPNQFKNTDFVATIALNVLHDLPFSQNQLLELADC
jgi:hypothetical protein